MVRHVAITILGLSVMSLFARALRLDTIELHSSAWGGDRILGLNKGTQCARQTYDAADFLQKNSVQQTAGIIFPKCSRQFPPVKGLVLFKANCLFDFGEARRIDDVRGVQSVSFEKRIGLLVI